MKIQKMIVTGDHLFLQRYSPLFESLSLYCERLELLPGDKSSTQLLKQVVKDLDTWLNFLPLKRLGSFQKNHKTFITRSTKLERKINQIGYSPSFVLHMFAMYCPFWQQFSIPYGMYLDYTMMLAKHNWPAWAPFASSGEFEAWKTCERLAYERAYHLFTMSNIVKCSLVEDYNIKPEKITVVGSFANRHKSYEGEKTFGSKQILFNGFDFGRKGGDLVLAAFRQIKAVIPDAKLIVIGEKLAECEAGVENPGRIKSQEKMRQLFLETDVVIAPGRCDPFPSFVIEAMNYGVPCIVSGNDGMPEIVNHGISGIVVKPLTPESIAENIIHLLNDIPTLTAMSQQAQQKVKTQLNCRKVAEEIMQVLLNTPSL